MGLANRWFDAQGVERQQDFSRNAGRKCLARWLSKVKAAYEEGFEDMARRVPNTDRARGLVGFEPLVDLDDIIESVVEEHRG